VVVMVLRNGVMVGDRPGLVSGCCKRISVLAQNLGYHGKNVRGS
jgi:hypothetical protein